MGAHGPLSTTSRAQQYPRSLINDLLNFARLDAGQVDVGDADVELGRLLDDLDALVGAQLRAKEIAYERAAAPAGGDDHAADAVVRIHVRDTGRRSRSRSPGPTDQRRAALARYCSRVGGGAASVSRSWARRRRAASTCGRTSGSARAHSQTKRS